MSLGIKKLRDLHRIVSGKLAKLDCDTDEYYIFQFALQAIQLEKKETVLPDNDSDSETEKKIKDFMRKGRKIRAVNLLRSHKPQLNFYELTDYLDKICYPPDEEKKVNDQ